MKPRLMTVDRGLQGTNTRVEVPVTDVVSTDSPFAGLIGVGASLVMLGLVWTVGFWRRFIP